jgi:hypothetical protein
MLISRLICATLLIGLGLKSGQLAISDYYFETANQRLQALNIDVEKTSRVLQPILNDVDKALYWRRNSAEALDLKADLLYQSWWLSPDGQYFQQSTLLKTAATLHLQALSIRKDWAFSVARLALIYSHQSTLDDRFERWFFESHRLGLYETTIARSLMTIGFQYWPQLSASQRRLTMDFTRVSIEQKANSAESMITFLDSYGKREEVCRTLSNTPRKLRVCEDFGGNALSDRFSSSS